MMDLYFKKPYASDIIYSSRNKKKAAPVLLGNNKKYIELQMCMRKITIRFPFAKL